MSVAHKVEQTATTVAARVFEEIAYEDRDGRWELHEGRLRGKPFVSQQHGDLYYQLGLQLGILVDRNAMWINTNNPRVRTPNGNVYIPDLVVIPAELGRSHRAPEHRLAIYDEALPLVVEVWSPSTGDYDVATKVPAYQARGDQEIWRLHPFDATLTIWRRRPDGSYDEETRATGVVEVASLPGVRIDLDALFAVLTD